MHVRESTIEQELIEKLGDSPVGPFSRTRPAGAAIMLLLVMRQGSMPQRILAGFVILLVAALGGFSSHRSICASSCRRKPLLHSMPVSP
ncbi:MAG: hypothetical protein R3F10_10155 [Lysobacteraceae bacterium]